MTSITSQKTQEELLRIIAFVKKKDDGRVFCDPVDVVALGLHDYHTIVLNPMDLSTVEKKLRAKSYQTMDAFVADVAQIWKNSELFNGATHSITLLGRELDGIFQKKLAELRASQEPVTPSPSLPRSRSSRSFKSSDYDVPAKEVTYEQKRNICLQINSLSPKELAKIVHIIHKYQPDLFFDTDNREEDIEINCEDLEVRTLLEFEKVLNQISL